MHDENEEAPYESQEPANKPKESFKLAYKVKNEDVVSIDSFHKLLRVVFGLSRSCSMAGVRQKGSGKEREVSLNIILREGDEEEKVQARSLEVVLKEAPDFVALPLFLVNYRTKHRGGGGNAEVGSVERVELRGAAVKGLMVRDLSAVYGKRGDPRLLFVPSDDVEAFLGDITASECKEEVGGLLRAHREDRRSSAAPEATGRRSASCEYVRVNGTEMAQFTSETKHEVVGIDCEMVFTDDGFEVGRVSVVSAEGTPLLDRLVHPRCAVKDYLTQYSGLRKESFARPCACRKCSNAGSSSECTKAILYDDLLGEMALIVGKSTVIIGHSLAHDLACLRIYHPLLVDTSLLFSSHSHYSMKLKDILRFYLNKTIQGGEHSSLVDAESAVLAAKLKILKGSHYGVSALKRVIPGVEVNVLANSVRNPSKYLARAAINFWISGEAGAQDFSFLRDRCDADPSLFLVEFVHRGNEVRLRLF